MRSVRDPASCTVLLMWSDVLWAEPVAGCQGMRADGDCAGHQQCAVVFPAEKGLNPADASCCTVHVSMGLSCCADSRRSHAWPSADHSQPPAALTDFLPADPEPSCLLLLPVVCLSFCHSPPLCWPPHHGSGATPPSNAPWTSLGHQQRALQQPKICQPTQRLPHRLVLVHPCLWVFCCCVPVQPSCATGAASQRRGRAA